MSSNAPPPPNPVLTAYEEFVRDTPLVTRYYVTTLGVTWFSSWFVNPTYALSNIPKYTIYNFELYRIILSPLLCDNVFSLILAYMSFTQAGKRLEFSMGSTAFGWMLLTLGVLTNLAFLATCMIMYFASDNIIWLYYSSSGLWIILFAMIAIDCSKAPPGTQRQLFFCEVPTLYYPMALMGIFSLLCEFNLSHMISIGLGYAYGHGKLDRLKVGQARFTRWEESVLANFTRRQGWVVGHAASGESAWSDEVQFNSGGGGLRRLFRRVTQQTEGDTEAATTESTGFGAAPGNVSPPEDPSAFPSSGGRSLGSSTSQRRPVTDARLAALAAAERRSAHRDEENP